MSYVVAGFYTPDYTHWASKLRASLHVHGQPHDLMLAEAAPGGWEANTLRKAEQIAKAMRAHGDKTIIWLDVDCTVNGSLAPLADTAADVAVYMHGRRRANGGYKLHAITRTIVLQPTRGARDFVARWAELSANAAYGDVDQTTFLLAMGESTDTSFRPLARKWSAVAADNLPDAMIVHDHASADTPKVTSLGRYVQRLFAA